MTQHASDVHPYVAARVEHAREVAEARVRILELLDDVVLAEAEAAAELADPRMSLHMAIKQLRVARSHLAQTVEGTEPA